MNALTVEMLQVKADARIDADMAEYEFNMYVAAGPGVKASDVLASMTGERNKSFWDAATYKAMSIRAEWLAA